MGDSPLLEPARVYRSRLGRATQTGNTVAAAEAEIGLRTHRLAKSIEKDTVGKPPLPQDHVRMLCDKLAGGVA